MQIDELWEKMFWVCLEPDGIYECFQNKASGELSMQMETVRTDV